MRSGLLNAPAAALWAAAPRAPVAALERRVADAMPPELSATPTVVLAGAPRSGKSSVVNALLAESGSTASGGPAGSRGPAPVGGLAPVSAYLIFGYGAEPAARAFVPGHREPRPIGLDQLRDTDVNAVGRGGHSRPARRIEVSYPAELLRTVALADPPNAGGLDPAHREVGLDAAARGAGVLFVTTAAAPMSDAEVDLVAEAARQGVPVTFAITHIDRYPDWSEVVSANRAMLRERAPELAAAWSPIDGSAGGADPDRVAVLRDAVLGLARAGAGPVGPAATVTAVRATAQAAEQGWAEILDREIRVHRIGAVQRLAIDLATSHVRCVQEIGSGPGCQRLPHAFDRELHALSVRTTRNLDAAAREVTRRVFGAILEATPEAGPLAAAPAAGGPVLDRVLAVVRRALAAAGRWSGDDGHILLLTATSGAAVISGPGVFASLAAVPARPGSLVLGEVGVGLTTGCYLMWQQKTTSDKRDCRRWLQQAVHVVEVELQRELNQRFADLQEALAAVASDTVDHGVLLA
jgi:hypothetical protein